MRGLERRGALILVATMALALGALPPGSALADVTLLNVSYDPTRELYEEFNDAFAKHWKQETGEDVTIKQSHGGSGKQARAVIDGLEADVVTLALAYDIDAHRASSGELLAEGLADAAAAQQRALHLDDRVPGAQGQPQGHPRLGRPGQARASRSSRRTRRPRAARAGTTWRRGAMRCEQNGGDEQKAQEFVDEALSRTCRCSTPARAARPRPSSQRGIGDVLLAWENEALPRGQGARAGQVRDRRAVGQHPGRAAGRAWSTRSSTSTARARWREAYLEYLYSPEGQELAAKHYYRPRDAERSPTNARAASRRSSCSRSTTCSAAGQKAQKPALRRRRRVRPDLPAPSK